MPYADLGERIRANSVTSLDCGHDGTMCWEWVGRRNSAGYPLMTIRMRSGPRKGSPVPRLAHRESLKFFTGRRLSTRSVCKHLCNNKNCVNPLHLAGGTQKSNMRQCVAEGRHGNMYRSPVRDMEENYERRPHQ